MRIGFFLREALRGLRRSSAPALAALLTVLLTALVLGVFIPIVQATTGTANEVRGRVVLDVYVSTEASPADRSEVQRTLESTANVKSVEYISKNEALEELGRKIETDEAIELLGTNPLPDLFRVTPDDPDRLDVIEESLLAGGRPALTGIDDVKNREGETDKILSATSLVKVIAAGLAALLVFASIALVANTIRLSIFARRREVEVMKLVGATNWFIRWPFVIEGVIVGFFGGLLAVLLLAIGKQTFIDPLSDDFALLAAPDTIDFPLLIALLIGIFLGGHPDLLPGGVRDAFVEEDRALRAEVIEKIEENFYKRVDEERLDDASLRGIVDSLDDPYSHYLTPDEAKSVRESISGEFEGVGMTVEEDRRGLRVLTVFEDSPAEDAGIAKGDLILSVDGRSISGVNSELATGRIKGPAGSEVELEVIGRGADRVVLDLRGNGGGLLTEAVLVSSIFIEDGEIVSVRGRSRPERVEDAEGDAIDEDIRVAVLVDGGSASASEIVAGALRDRGRATLVGTNTFGKGLVQEVEPLSNGGYLDLTVANYYLPGGKNIGEGGLKPQVRASDNPETERDEALPIALDVLVGQRR